MLFRTFDVQLFDLFILGPDSVIVEPEVLVALIEGHFDRFQLLLRHVLLLHLVLRLVRSQELGLLRVLVCCLHIIVFLLELLDLPGMVSCILVLLLLEQLNVLHQLHHSR